MLCPNSLDYTSSSSCNQQMTAICPFAFKVKVKVIFPPTAASRSWCQAPSGTRDQFFFLLEIFFRQLWVCYFVAPSLTRGRVCNLLLLLVLASAVPWDSDPILLSQFLRLPQPGGPGPRIYILQEQGGPDIPPGTGFPSIASYDSQGYSGGILSHLHLGTYCVLHEISLFKYMEHCATRVAT
jgi:hypothetical protein